MKNDDRLNAVDQRIADISRKIDTLHAERASLLAQRSDLLLLIGDGDGMSVDGRNLEKFRTWGRVRRLLADYPDGLSTSEIMKLLAVSFSEERNPVTIRSHLRRLEAEKLLVSDASSKKWRLPLVEAEKE